MEFLKAVNPVALLKDEFASNDMESKLRAASRLRLLAVVLGADKTCSELLPAVTGKRIYFALLITICD